MRFIAVLLVLLAFAGISFALTVNSCGYLSISGESYLVSQNLSGEFNDSNSGRKTCLAINASNIILDCGGYTLSSILNLSNTGILIYHVDNVTVRNCRVTGYDEGISAYNSTNSNISSNHVYDNTPTGVGIYMTRIPMGAIFSIILHTRLAAASMSILTTTPCFPIRHITSLEVPRA